MANKPRVLFVDDEQHILDSFRASLRKKFAISTANGPQEALKMIAEKRTYAVIVSDFKMPEMDGVEFLSRIQPLSPDTVRVMLTGHADVDTTILAVNRGQVFRFLTKPTPLDELERVLDLAVKQHKLIIAEKELLNGTVKGSIQLLTDVLSLSNPEAFGRSERTKKLAVLTAKQLGGKKTLIMELAAMLSQIGLVSLSPDALHQLYKSERLPPTIRQLYENHPKAGAKLLKNIPRLEKVAEVVSLQQMPLHENPDMPAEAKILKTVLDFDMLKQQGKTTKESLIVLSDKEDTYDPKVVAAFKIALKIHDNFVKKDMEIRKLKTGMIVAKDIRTRNDILLMTQGQEISEAALERLHIYARNNEISEPLTVFAQEGSA